MPPDTLISPSTARTNRRRPTGTSGRARGGEAPADRHAGVVRFTRALLHSSGTSIQRRARSLAARRLAADDDIAWWQATLTLDRTLRGTGRQVEGALGARLAVQALLTAAARAGLPMTSEVAAVARSAGEVARGLVAGDVELTNYLSRGWEDLLIPPARTRALRRLPAKRDERLRGAGINQTRSVRDR